MTEVISSSPRADGSDRLGCFHDSFVEVVEAGDCPVAGGLLGLLFDLGGSAVGVEVDDAVPLRVLHVIAEHGGAGRAGCCGGDEVRQAGAVEEVVAEHERCALSVEEVGADQKGLGEPIGRVLGGVVEVEAPL